LGTGAQAYTSAIVPDLLRDTGASIDRVPIGWYTSLSASDPRFKAVWNADQAAGVNVMWVLTNSQSETECTYSATTECAINPLVDRKDAPVYESFAATLATTYPGSIIEVWNEENNPSNWMPGGTNDYAGYGLLLEQTYSQVKSARPSTQVVMGGLSGNDMPSYLSNLYTTGAMASTDAVNVHLYPWPENTEDFSVGLNILSGVEQTRASNNDKKPIWVTEFGVAQGLTPPSGSYPIDLVRQADDLRHYYHLVRGRLLADDPGKTPVLLAHTLLNPGNDPYGTLGVQTSTDPSNPGGNPLLAGAVQHPAFCAVLAMRSGPAGC
jgi:hypothetical protein